MEKASLGKRIREARLQKGYTQQTLSEKADIGEMYLSEIERGVKMPSMNLFIKLITALDISADYVLRDIIKRPQFFKSSSMAIDRTAALITVSNGQTLLWGP